KDLVATGEQFWNPESRETADHSLPYVVAAALVDGALTRHSFNDNRLWSPELRALLQKIEVIDTAEFTTAYGPTPREQRARVTVLMQNGEKLIGEAGGGKDDLAAEKSDEQIADKFHGVVDELLGTKRANALLERLWRLETIEDISLIPPMMVLD